MNNKNYKFHIPIIRRTILFGIVLINFFATSAQSVISTIELIHGGLVKAEIISKKTDRVFVDLGFTIIEIPKEAILQISDNIEVEDVEKYNEDLYIIQKNAATHPVKDLVGNLGEAVALIKTPTGIGSGFVIHPDGYVITNDHVIAGEHKITVTIYEQGKQELKKIQWENVRIVATNSNIDLALLKIENNDSYNFKTVPIGSSDNLKQGQTIFSIGNPLGLERSVSKGIVSLRNRLIGGRLFIQSTAQISPGNSGGPLFNLYGEVIGITNMKVMGSGAEGLAFAIPANELKSFLKNRDAFAFDPRSPNSGYLYNEPPQITKAK